MALAFGKRRKLLAYLAFAGVVCTMVPANANPTGGAVVAGSATIKTAPNAVTVHQHTDRAIINWQNFSIGPGEITRLKLPSASAAILNRVMSSNPSAIYGQLKSNGQVYLLNPNGILIGPNGQIKTSGFVASTLDVNNAAFLNGGPLSFAGTSNAGIINLGTIRTSAGDVALFAAQVQNAGTITAPNGTVALGSGSQILYVPGGGDNTITIAAPPVTTPNGAAIDNSGLIAAAAAQLKAVGSPYALAINNGGLISATTTHNDGGRVLLDGGPGATVMNGTILARGGANGGNGGLVEVSGGSLSFAGKVDTSAPKGKTGTLLLDPLVLDSSNVPGIVSTLNTSNVTETATDSVTVSTAINNSTTTHTLILDAPTITVNAPISLNLGGLTFQNTSGTTTGSSLTSSTAGAITATNILVSGPFATTTLSGPVSTGSFGALTVNETTPVASFTATNAANNISSIDFSHSSFTGGVNVGSSSAMTLKGQPTAGSFQFTSAGVLTAFTGAVLTSTGGNTVLASTGAQFVNLGGTGVVAGLGRKIIYSSDNSIANFSDGGLGYTQYNPVTFGNDPIGAGNVVYLANSTTLPAMTVTGTATRTYGSPDSFSATFSGGSAADVLQLAFTDQSGATNVGTYTNAIVPSGISSTRALSFGPAGTLTINPATLFFTVNNATGVYNPNGINGSGPGATTTSWPAFSASFTGFVGSDNSSMITGMQFTTNATNTSQPGLYNIIAAFQTGPGYPAGGGYAKAGNYNVVPLNGTGASAVLTIQGCAAGSICFTPTTPNPGSTPAPITTSQYPVIVTLTGDPNTQSSPITITNTPLTVNVEYDFLGLASNSAAFAEEQDVMSTAATDSGVPNLELLLLSNDPQTKAKAQATLLPFLLQDLQNILSIDQSKWTPQQAAFVNAMTAYIQAQRKTAAEDAVAQYQAWLTQQNLKFQSLTLDANGNPSQIGIFMQAAASTQPPIPPSSFLQQVLAGMSLTNDQINAATQISFDIATAAASTSTGLALSGNTSSAVVTKALPVMNELFPNTQAMINSAAKLATIKAIESGASDAAALAAGAEATATSTAEVVGTALGSVGLVLEVAAAITTVALGIVSYSQIGAYNTAFNTAVQAAYAPVTISDLKSMDINTLSGYMTTMLASGGTVGTLGGPSLPSAILGTK